MTKMVRTSVSKQALNVSLFMVYLTALTFFLSMKGSTILWKMSYANITKGAYGREWL